VLARARFASPLANRKHPRLCQLCYQVRCLSAASVCLTAVLTCWTMAPPLVASRLGRPVYLPLLFLTFALAVADLGISATLVSHYGSQFGNENLGSRTRQICFAATWNTLFGLILLIGDIVAPSVFALSWNFLALFLGFLQFLVGGVTITRTLTTQITCSNFDKCTLFRAQEGVTWACCWINFFAVLVLAWIHISTPAPTARKGKEVEEA